MLDTRLKIYVDNHMIVMIITMPQCIKCWCWLETQMNNLYNNTQVFKGRFHHHNITISACVFNIMKAYSQTT